MKKILKKYRVKSTRDDVPMTGHIHSLRIRAVAIEGINFGDKETAHFDVCRDCRLQVIDALRNLGPQAQTIMAKTA